MRVSAQGSPPQQHSSIRSLPVSSPWKTIWLSFVRRAYRKFGKTLLAHFDLRWRANGAIALSSAISRALGTKQLLCSPQALAWADMHLSHVEAAISGRTSSSNDRMELVTRTSDSLTHPV